MRLPFYAIYVKTFWLEETERSGAHKAVTHSAPPPPALGSSSSSFPPRRANPIDPVAALRGSPIAESRGADFSPEPCHLICGSADRGSSKMNLQPVVQPRSSVNGFGGHRVDRVVGSRMESTLQTPKSSSCGLNSSGLSNGSKRGGLESHSRDRLIFVSTCLIGHSVEVHVKNGSILSGIFHATNAEKDFGIVLKMARVIKDGSVRGPKPVCEIVKRPQTMIIPARELVQVIAKGMTLTTDGFSSGNACEKRQDLMTDSAISQSRRVEGERELERWTPDKDDLQYPGLDNIFDRHWNRSWDQFETNEALFGVKSTFDEELYTTKLERGPRMRDLEREATRIAREIEGEETQDLHLAEERGLHFDEDFELDEESRYSSVYRGFGSDVYKENEDMDDINTETFGGSFRSVTNRQFSEVSQRRNNDGTQASSTSSSLDEDGSSLKPASRDVSQSASVNVRQLTTDHVLKTLDNERLEEKQLGEKRNFEQSTQKSVFEDVETTKSEEIQSSLDTKKCSLDKGILSASATAYSPSSVQEHKDSQNESSGTARSAKFSSSKQPVNPQARPSSSTSSTSEHVGETSTSGGPALSPSSSVGSLSSEKSALNPHAKEFKLNPNAKSFVPSASLRPHTPVPESTFYYPANPGLPHMHGLSIGPTFPGQQPVVYNPQAVQMQAPQAYVSPAVPLYGQQMILGQPRPVLYMPGYPPEMPYKGRDF
uniref:Ataxin-2 n=1 Tax=Anthurium amnicola TaxID=1678845 RepID=A0A1D1YZB5_9ARAE